MAFINDETKYNIQLVWASVLQSFYSFPPLQRIALVFGVIAILPAYLVVRVGANAYYSYEFKKTEIVAHRSFVNPQSLRLAPVKILSLNDGSYVAYAKVTNPNLDLALYSGFYTFAFKNKEGEQVHTSQGQLYLLPGQDQYVLASRFVPLEQIVSGTLQVTDMHWQKRFEIPTILLVTPAAIAVDAVDEDGVKIEGSVINESPYELGKVKVTFLLKDNAGNVVGIVQREERTVRPGERRAFPQVWPGLSRADISSIETFATTNALDSANLRVEFTERFVPEEDDN